MLDKRITEIPEGMAIVMNHPIIQFMMCGIVDMRQKNDGTITLTYEDMTKESRISEKYIEDMNCFETVRYVQEGREQRPCQHH